MPSKEEMRQKRHGRVRKTVVGTSDRPRLNVFRSLNNIYAQVVDDTTYATLASASTIDKELKAKLKTGGDIESARLVGELVAKRAKKKGVAKVVFDRGGYQYHGRVKSLAEGARAEGLEF